MQRSVCICSFFVSTLFWVAAAPRASAQYTASLLYPLTAFNGSPVGGGGIDVNNIGQAVGGTLFWPGNVSPINLGFPGTETLVSSVAGTQQVGLYGSDATLWTGSASSAVNLNPMGASSSNALATSGSQQVGYASKGLSGSPNAYLWTGSAATAKNLNPTNYSSSTALGTDGTQQVGSAGSGTAHAILWSGSASSYVDLNPSEWVDSEADGVDGTQQVGYGAPPGSNPDYTLAASDVQALLWTGSADSYVDLNPTGYLLSQALATNGAQQVGEAWVTGSGGLFPDDAPGDAMVWSSTANSAVDLSPSLPSTDTWLSSTATSIDSSGDVFGYAVDSGKNYYAVEWTPTVPEPASAGLLAFVMVGVFHRRRHRP